MIRIADIQRVVAEHYGLPARVIRQNGLGSRDPSYIKARHVAMYLSRRILTDDPDRNQTGRGSLTTLGRHFSRDHTTVLHGIRKVAANIQQDNDLRADVETLELELVSQKSANNQDLLTNICGESEIPAFAQFRGGA